MKARQYVFGIHGLREADKLVNLSHMLKVFQLSEIVSVALCFLAILPLG